MLGLARASISHDGAQARHRVEVSEPPAIAPLIVLAYGLTDREREVMQRMLQGLSTKEIAVALGISPYTVQEHFQAIFDKVGVRSRRELVGHVFHHHYLGRSSSS